MKKCHTNGYVRHRSGRERKNQSTNVSKDTEKTSETSKKEYGEAGNVHNRIIDFYECGEDICQLTYGHACTSLDRTLNSIQGKLNECTNTT